MSYEPNPILRAARGSSVSTDAYPSTIFHTDADAVAEAQRKEQAAETAKIRQAEQERLSQSRFERLTPTEAEALGRQPVGEPAIGSRLYGKHQYLTRGTGQWRSEQEFQAAAQATGAAAGGGNYAGSIIQDMPQPEQQRAPQNPAYNPTGRRDSVFMPETRYDPKYGAMIRKDISDARQQANLRSFLPDITASSISQKSVSVGRTAAARIRKLNIDTSGVPAEIKSSAGYKISSSVLGYGRESVARAAEFGSMILPTSEMLVKTATKKPSALPGMAIIGAGSFIQGTYESAKSNPKQFVSDIVVTAGVFKGIRKIKSAAVDTVKFSGKTFVPPEKIIEPQVLSGAERFPLAPRGTTARQLIKEFKTSPYKLPGSEGKTGGWHATPEAFAKNTLTQAGTSEGKGLYIAPSTSPHFWKIGSNYKLFGWDTPPTSPTGIWLETAGIKRSPPNTRMNIAAQNRFLMGKAPKGTAYISSAFEKGIKPEKEAIIPPETPISRVSNQL